MVSRVKNDLKITSRKNAPKAINGFKLFECDDYVSISDASTKDANKLKTADDNKQ